MSLQTEQRTLVHIQCVCAVIVNGVNEEMIGHLLYLTGFAEEGYDDDTYKPRVELIGSDAIVRFYSHGNAKFFLEEIIATRAHRVDWYLEPGQQLDMKSREVDEGD